MSFSRPANCHASSSGVFPTATVGLDSHGGEPGHSVQWGQWANGESFPTGRTSRRPLPLASARSCMSDSERNESPMRRRSNPRDRITLEFLHGRNRVADQMASDHLERHLADSPRLVSRGPHDYRCSSILPGVKESARAPDPRPGFRERIGLMQQACEVHRSKYAPETHH